MLRAAAAFVALTAWLAADPAPAQGIPADAYRYQRDLVREARLVWGMSAPVATFAAQIHAESYWRPHAVSRVGAQGLTQFMPATAAWIATAYPELGRAAPLDPRWAMRAMLRYNRHNAYALAPALDRCEAAAMWTASYNQGRGWTERARAASPWPQIWFGATEDVNPGKSHANFLETRRYVRRILLDLEPRYRAAGWGPGTCAR